jgi:hypothetical protein
MLIGMKPTKLRKNPEAHFWQFVQKADGDGCWLWTRSMNNQGYGRTWWIDNKLWLVHRLAWTLTHGPIPKGLFVCHRCDIPLCVRPDHMFVGTNAENLADMRVKGRGFNLGARTAKLNAETVRAIRRRYAAGETVGELERAFRYDHANISKIIRRTIWKSVE